MKLRNRKTGEIGYTAVLRSKDIVVMDENAIQLGSYTSLAELNEEWEDAPEKPKEYWFIDYDSGIIPFSKMKETATDRMMKQIGNYFLSREEAEQAVEKLKTWKRLKDKGFKFGGVEVFSEGLLEIDGVLSALESADKPERLKIVNDLDLLFSQEDGE